MEGPSLKAHARSTGGKGVGLPPLVFVELFGGILPASTAAAELGLHLSAVYYSETGKDLYWSPQMALEAVGLGAIMDSKSSDIGAILQQWPHAQFGIFGEPPRKDVIKLKSNRAGAHGPSSGLHAEIPRACLYFFAKTPG